MTRPACSFGVRQDDVREHGGGARGSDARSRIAARKASCFVGGVSRASLLRDGALHPPRTGWSDDHRFAREQGNDAAWSLTRLGLVWPAPRRAVPPQPSQKPLCAARPAALSARVAARCPDPSIAGSGPTRASPTRDRVDGRDSGQKKGRRRIPPGPRVASSAARDWPAEAVRAVS